MATANLQSHSSLVVAVAFELQQFVDAVEQCQYLGVPSGSNTHLSNYFNDTLKMGGSAKKNIRNVFRDISNNLQDEIAFLNNHSLFESVNGKYANDFTSTYRSCGGLGNAFRLYISDFGKYCNDPIYLPLCKYFVSLANRGDRPGFSRCSHMLLEDRAAPGVDEAFCNL